MTALEAVAFVLSMLISLPGLLLSWCFDALRRRTRVRLGWCLALGVPLGLAVALLLAGACRANGLHEIPGGPDAPRVPSFPLPPDRPTFRLVEPRVQAGDTITGRVLLEANISLALTIRLVPSEGAFHAPELDEDYPRAHTAKARLETLLTGGPFWIQLTGDRTAEWWAGRVFRMVEAEVPTAQGIRTETRIENVADRMRAEGFDAAGGE